jgi:hypothetical protein
VRGGIAAPLFLFLRSYTVDFVRLNDAFCLRQHGTHPSFGVRFFRAERGKTAHIWDVVEISGFFAFIALIAFIAANP